MEMLTIFAGKFPQLLTKSTVLAVAQRCFRCKACRHSMMEGIHELAVRRNEPWQTVNR